MRELIAKAELSRDELLKYIGCIIEFIKDDKYSWSDKYVYKNESIDYYEHIIEVVKNDEQSAKYMTELYKEKDGDTLKYSVSVQCV